MHLNCVFFSAICLLIVCRLGGQGAWLAQGEGKCRREWGTTLFEGGLKFLNVYGCNAFSLGFFFSPLNLTPSSLRGGLKLWQHNVTVHIAVGRESLKIPLESLKILLVFFLNTQQFLCNFKTNRRTDEQTNKLPCYATFHTHSLSPFPLSGID